MDKINIILANGVKVYLLSTCNCFTLIRILTTIVTKHQHLVQHLWSTSWYLNLTASKMVNNFHIHELKKNLAWQAVSLEFVSADVKIPPTNL
jgi:hypothetical protein